jgi:hypothetical protein
MSPKGRAVPGLAQGVSDTLSWLARTNNSERGVMDGVTCPW